MSSSTTAPASPTLWMGDLEPYMDEYFIMQSFLHFGEPVHTVKLIKNKHTCLPAGYCFVDFVDAEAARKAMLRLNGKVIPNTSPEKRFKLNPASYGKEHLMVPEYSLFVGDLSDDVDDYMLYNAFARRYQSCRAAKVVLDNRGRSKGYGFVRFTEEVDQQRALIEMQHMTGIGRKPVRVSLATPKRPPPPDAPGTGRDRDRDRDGHHEWDRDGKRHRRSSSSSSDHYANYNNNYYSSNWGGYTHSSYYYNPYYPGSSYENSTQYDYYTGDDEDMLEEPELEIDVNNYNKDFMEQSEEIFSMLEESRWYPVDSLSTKFSSMTAPPVR